MTFYLAADGDDFSSDDFKVLMEQTVSTYATRAARSAALVAGYVTEAQAPEGMLTYLQDEDVLELHLGSAVWQVVGAKRTRNVLTATYTPPATTDASLATTIAGGGTLSFLFVPGTYRITGSLWLTSGTAKLTSSMSGAMYGSWGVGPGAGANSFIQTPAEASFALSTGFNPVSGTVRVASGGTWSVKGYNGTGGVIDIDSGIAVERIL